MYEVATNTAAMVIPARATIVANRASLASTKIPNAGTTSISWSHDLNGHANFGHRPQSGRWSCPTADVRFREQAMLT